MITVRFGSIRERLTTRRMPFQIVGEFKTRTDFIKSLKEALRCDDGDDSYDFRTIKFHDKFELTGVSSPTVTVLEYMQEDLIPGPSEQYALKRAPQY
jgi:hypothetical protein